MMCLISSVMITFHLRILHRFTTHGHRHYTDLTAGQWVVRQ